MQSSFASSNRIAESNDNLAAALQWHKDLQERELKLQEAKYLEKEKSIKQERNMQQQESLFQRAHFYASIGELQKARKLFDNLEAMDLLESST